MPAVSYACFYQPCLFQPQNLFLAFDKTAVMHLARLGQWTGHVHRWKAYLKYRPPARQSADPAVRAKAWWQFTRQCIKLDSDNDRYVVDGAACIEGGKARRTYVELYTRRSGTLQEAEWVTAVTEPEQAALQAIEDRYPLAVIQAWRRQAWADLHAETARREAVGPS
eukprot:SAG22_NODE_5188_length_1067_cov_1.628099_2_plen_167_part_00